jgi:putative heme-binding domain-containing protein
LKSGSAAIRRAAAEALGRIGDARAVPDLLEAAASPADRVLEHSITYALIEINDPSSLTGAGAQATSIRTRRAALIALDQMDNATLKAPQIVALLDDRDPVLRDTAWWIAGHHPEWGTALAEYFQARLAAPALSRAGRDDLQQKLGQFGDNPAIQQLLAGTIEHGSSIDERLGALRVMAVVARTRLKTAPSLWIAPVLNSLASENNDVAAQALAVIRAFPAAKEPLPDVQAALLRAGRDANRPIGFRLDALAAIQGGLPSVDADIFEVLRRGLESGQPVAVKASAAAVVEKSSLSAAQLVALAASLRTAGPLELPRLLRPFGHSSEEAAGLAMVNALQASTSRASVRADVLRPLLANYPASVQQAGEALMTALNTNSAEQLGRLQSLLPAIQGGDIARGQAVFNSQKAACYACHAIGYMGGKIGPDLTRIGQVRSERDLLEAIVFPSASFARGYEPVVIRTRAGDVHTGVLRNNDLPDEVVIATEREETRIPRRDIVEMQPGTVSLMPPGFDEQLTRQELSDLLAFLKATRSGA